MHKKTWNELTTPFRAKNNELLELWTKVRKLEEDVEEYLVNYGYSSTLNESIFQRCSEDEIILCLNYNVLYGINNMNRFLQNNNPSPGIRWGMWPYQVGDSVLFNDNKRFSPVLFNTGQSKVLNKKITLSSNFMLSLMYHKKAWARKGAKERGLRQAEQLVPSKERGIQRVRLKPVWQGNTCTAADSKSNAHSGN